MYLPSSLYPFPFPLPSSSWNSSSSPSHSLFISYNYFFSSFVSSSLLYLLPFLHFLFFVFFILLLSLSFLFFLLSPPNFHPNRSNVFPWHSMVSIATINNSLALVMRRRFLNTFVGRWQIVLPLSTEVLQRKRIKLHMRLLSCNVM